MQTCIKLRKCGADAYQNEERASQRRRAAITRAKRVLIGQLREPSQSQNASIVTEMSGDCAGKARFDRAAAGAESKPKSEHVAHTAMQDRVHKPVLTKAIARLDRGCLAKAIEQSRCKQNGGVIAMQHCGAARECFRSAIRKADILKRDCPKHMSMTEEQKRLQRVRTSLRKVDVAVQTLCRSDVRQSVMTKSILNQICGSF